MKWAYFNFWLKLKHAVQRTFLLLSHFYQQILKKKYKQQQNKQTNNNDNNKTKQKTRGRKAWCLKCGTFPNLSNVVGDFFKKKHTLCVMTVGDAADLSKFNYLKVMNFCIS